MNRIAAISCLAASMICWPPSSALCQGLESALRQATAGQEDNPHQGAEEATADSARVNTASLLLEETTSRNPNAGVVEIPEFPQAVEVGTLRPYRSRGDLPADSEWLPMDNNSICGVHCDDPAPRRCRKPSLLGRGADRGWSAQTAIPWQVFAQGEYIGPHRRAHVPVYRVRVDDVIAFVYRLSGEVSPHPYRLNVRDQIRVESVTAGEVVDRDVVIQPDGTITLRLVGQVPAAGLTIEELREDLEKRYGAHLESPMTTVTPLVSNSTLEELRSAVDSRYGAGGQYSRARVTPEGTVQLPAIGSVPAQGLSLDELGREVEERYAQLVEGLEVTPVLDERAPRYVFVVGEVQTPGRYVLEGPTTVMQAIAMAGSWNVGAHLKHVVVFRRDKDWRLMATKLDLRAALQGRTPCPPGEIWLRDSDIVIVPKSPILVADEFIEMVFTRGIYGVFPMAVSLNFAKLSTL